MVSFIYVRPLKVILLYMAVAIFLWIFLMSCVFPITTYLKKTGKWINIVFSIVSIFAISYLTVLNRTGSKEEVILRPFYSFIEARRNSEMYRSMLMNVFLFFPAGLFLPYALPEKIRHNVFLTILFAAAFSAAIEAMQYYFRLGRCETDDVIMNTLGAAVGSLSYVLYRQLEKYRRRNS